MRRLRTLLALTSLVAGTAALAQTSPAPSAGWQFEASPYLWGAGIDGETGIGRLPAIGVEASFSDLVDVLDFGLMGTFEARYNRWGLLFDGVYIELEDDGPAPNPAFGTVDASMKEQIYALEALYRVVDGPVSVDLTGGTRYTSLDLELGLTGGVASGRRVGRSESWWNAIVGTRVRYQPGKHWTIAGYVDVGAGGSDLTWQAVAGGGYAFNKLFAIGFGYRYLDDDYEKEDFVYDMAMAGPYLGGSFRW